MEWMKAEMKAWEMSQLEMAVELDSSQAYVNRILRGKIKPGWRIMNRIMEFFDCHMEFIPNQKNGEEEENGLETDEE